MKTTVTGNAIVVETTITAEEFCKIKKTKPEALTLYEGEGDNKEAVFAIEFNKNGAACVDPYGIVFNGTTHDDARRLTATLTVRGDFSDPCGFVADQYGVALTRLQALEASLPAVIEQVDAARAALLENISAQ